MSKAPASRVLAPAEFSLERARLGGAQEMLSALAYAIWAGAEELLFLRDSIVLRSNSALKTPSEAGQVPVSTLLRSHAMSPIRLTGRAVTDMCYVLNTCACLGMTLLAVVARSDDDLLAWGADECCPSVSMEQTDLRLYGVRVVQSDVDLSGSILFVLGDVPSDRLETCTVLLKGEMYDAD